MSRIIFHLDMDAFFAQIEQVKNPALRGKPVVVGGAAGKRGVVSTCSYEAREYGIHSAMSSARARQLCPHAIFLSGNLTSYTYYSARIQQILRTFTSHIQPTSVDEAYLDVTDTVHLYGCPCAMAQAIKDAIREQVGLTCTIGISVNKLLAKTASDMNKPDGLTTLWESELEEKYLPLPIRKLRGVGPQTEKALHKLGIMTIRDLAGADEKLLKKRFGIYGELLIKKANGKSSDEVLADDDQPEEKSISNEHTLFEDTSDPDTIRSILLALSEKVARRMRKAGFFARTIRLKMRYADFTTFTREVSHSEMTNDSDVIFHTAYDLIPMPEALKNRVRLIGVGVTKLYKSDLRPQIDLFNENASEKQEKCGQAVQGIREKYGKHSIIKAGSLRLGWKR